jgi:hypothetical protein
VRECAVTHGQLVDIVTALPVDDREAVGLGGSAAKVLRLVLGLSPGGELPIWDAFPSAADVRLWQGAFRRLLQLEIAKVELVALKCAIDTDEAEGFEKGQSADLPGLGDSTEPLEAQQAYDTFLSYREALAPKVKSRVMDELRSDAGAPLASRAAAVTVGVLSSRTSGFPKLVTAAVKSTRGLMRLITLAVQNMTGTALQRVLFVILTAAAGLAIALATLGDVGGGSGSGAGSTLTGVLTIASVVVLVIAFAVSMFGRLWKQVAAGAGAALLLSGVLLLLTAPKYHVAQSGDSLSRVHLVSNIAERNQLAWVIIAVVAASTLIGVVSTVSYHVGSHWFKLGAALAIILIVAGLSVVDAVADWKPTQYLPPDHRVLSGWQPFSYTGRWMRERYPQLGAVVLVGILIAALWGYLRGQAAAAAAAAAND